MRAVCLTSNAYAHCLPPFIHLWRRFCPLSITIAGYDVLPTDLPPGVDTLSIGRQEDYTWSGGVLRMLDLIDDELILLVLEDYFLSAPVDTSVINALVEILQAREDVVKIDLSNDRLKLAYHRYGVYKKAQLVKSAPDTLFQMSMQAALWKTDFMRRFLDPTDDAWQAEKKGTNRILAARASGEFSGLILGTLQPPMQYVNAIGGEGTMPGTWALHRFPQWMREELSAWVR